MNKVEIYSCEQLEWNKKVQKTKREKEESVPKEIIGPVTPVQSQPRPERATKKIFAPKTKDMNTRFLMFTEDNTGFTGNLLSLEC